MLMEEFSYYNTDNILNKYEFKNIPNRRYVYQQPRQLLLRNLISKNTIYDSVLLYHSVGVGKTLAAIGIAEGFKEYINNIGNRIFVLIKNGNIEENFRKELKSQFLGDTYNIEPEDGQEVEDLQNKINRRINKVYSFMTYGTFVNQTLGAKVFEKDQYGFNTKKQVKNADNQIIRKGANQIENLNNTVIIIDEAHNVTNNDVYLALQKTLKNSYNYRIVLLTATPIYDNVKEIFEISNLLNMNNPDNLLPIRNELYKNNLVEKSASGNLKGSTIFITDKGKTLLEKTLKGKVSYMTIDTFSFAKKTEIGTPLTTITGSTNIVKCKMSPNQDQIYLSALNLDTKKEPEDLSDEIESLDSNENENENTITIASSSLYKNSSDASTCVYPGKLFGKEGYNKCFENDKLKSEYNYMFTTNLEYYSSKLFALLQNINKSPGSAFVYSNYVNFGGIALVKQLLLSNGYKEYNGNSNSKNVFLMYDDSVPLKKRELYRQIFNSEDNKYGDIIKVIIGSPIVSEGISLYNVRQIHILEPSWNMSSINQIIGRGIRYMSHNSLPENERTIDIFKYVSVGSGISIDMQKYLLAENKDRSNKNVERLLKRIAFDCSFNKKTGIGGSPECDYQDCDYKCDINDTSLQDKFTYNMFIDFFDKYDIEYATELIKDIFKMYFVWSIDDILNKIKTLTNNIITTESIFTSIYTLLHNKVLINDKFNRTGFLIQKGDFLIFNPINAPIESSIFSKMLDFSIDSNEYNLQDYLKFKNKEKRLSESKIFKIPEPEIVNEPIVITKKIENIENTTLQNAYNNNIIDNNDIYASFKNKNGENDAKLRIIDTRNVDKETQDNRTIPTGMVLTSKKIPDIMNMIEYLNINCNQLLEYHTTDKNTIINILKLYTDSDLSNYTVKELLSKINDYQEITIHNIQSNLKLNKKQLINILYKHLETKGLVLK
jgi:superfamily II DNA or RNA helicase